MYVQASSSVATKPSTFQSCAASRSFNINLYSLENDKLVSRKSLCAVLEALFHAGHSAAAKAKTSTGRHADLENTLKFGPGRKLTIFGSWEGEYVPFTSIEHFLNNLEALYEIHIPLSGHHKSNNPQLQSRMLGIDGSKYGLLVADQLHPQMALVRTDDWAIHRDQLLGKPGAWENWNDSDVFVPVVEARLLQLSPGMQQSSEKLERLSQLVINRSALPLSDDDSDETTTSLVTSPSFKEMESALRAETQEQFRFRKRKKIDESAADSEDRVAEWLKAACDAEE